MTRIRLNNLTLIPAIEGHIIYLSIGTSQYESKGRLCDVVRELKEKIYMSSHATASPERSYRGKSSARLAVLLVTAAAFLLLPVAHAAAANAMKLSIIGTGSGKVNPAPPPRAIRP